MILIDNEIGIRHRLDAVVTLLSDTDKIEGNDAVLAKVTSACKSLSTQMKTSVKQLATVILILSAEKDALHRLVTRPIATIYWPTKLE
jgi:hypothetical protein